MKKIAFWSNPNKAPLGGYFIYVIDYKVNGVVQGQKVFIQDHTGTTTRDITPARINTRTAGEETYGFQTTTSGWHHVLFSGGFAFVLNNGIDRPYYILDQKDNTDINQIPLLAELPGWDDYINTLNIYNSSYGEDDTTLFYLGKNIDFSLEKLLITIQGTETTFANADYKKSANIDLTSNSVLDISANTIIVDSTFYAALTDGNPITYRANSPESGVAPAGLTDGVIYFVKKHDNSTKKIKLFPTSTDVTNNTNVVNITALATAGTKHFFDKAFKNNIVLSFDPSHEVYSITFNIDGTAIAVGNTLKIDLASVNPIILRCGIIRGFGDHLVAGNLTKIDANDLTSVVEVMTGVVKTSDVAAPGEIPRNWNPNASGVSTAEEVTLSETFTVKDMLSLQGNLYIYTTGSIHVMTPTNAAPPAPPFSFSKITDAHGVLSANILKEYEGRHFVVGTNDIYIFAGNPGDKQSVADGRVRQFFFDNLNPIYEQQVFTLQNVGQNEIWLCYPTIASTSGECNEALIWNYRSNTWTIRDLKNVTSGDVSPIKGGGIPSAVLKLSGESGNFGYITKGQSEVQRLTINGSAVKAHAGVKEKQTITVGSFNTFTASGEHTIIVNYPDGTTSSAVLGASTGTSITQNDLASIIKVEIDGNTNWSAEVSSNVVTCTSAILGDITNLFNITIVTSGTLPNDVNNNLFTEAQTRQGRNASSDVDTLTLIPPTGYGDPINVSLTDGSTFDIDSGSGTEHLTAIQVATLVANAFSSTHFTVNRTDAHLDFTSINNINIPSEWSYTINQGTVRLGYDGGQTLISNATGSTTTQGVTSAFARGTHVKVTTNAGTVLFDKHYGEGPGRLLDTTFTLGANDTPYGAVTGGQPASGAVTLSSTTTRSTADDNKYLSLFYNESDGTANAKPNGMSVSLSQNAIVNNSGTTNIDLVATNVIKDILNAIETSASSNEVNITVTTGSLTNPTELTIVSSKFSSDAQYVASYIPLTNASVAPTSAAGSGSSSASHTTSNAFFASSATAVNSAAAANPTTTGSSILTDFDIERPWSSTNLNPNKLFPVFAESGFVTNTLFNRIRAADIGTKFGTDTYVSYIERVQSSIVPNLDTEQVVSMSLWGDGGTVTTVGGEPQPATLKISARTTNNPGQLAYLTTSEDNTQSNAKANKLVVNNFSIGSDYKLDLNVFGRFLNYRIEDNNNDKEWNISGIQMRIKKGGTR